MNIYKNYTELQKELSETLKWTKPRIELFLKMIESIIIAKNITLTALSNLINSKVKAESNLRRIQRFLTDFKIDFKAMTILMSGLMSKFLPKDKKWKLSMDRTNWKFGTQNINILMLSVITEDGMAIPIIWELLDKKGNSNTKERISIMKRFIEAFGSEKAEVLLADREFFGKEWFQYLKNNGIEFIVRLRKSARVKTKKGYKRVENFFRKVQKGDKRVSKNMQIVYGQEVYLAVTYLDEFSYIVSSFKSSKIPYLYKQRWEIETLFGAFKSRGFNLENTHLKDREKIKKLLVPISFSFIFAFMTGKWRNKKRKITMKKHGRPQYSIFRYGLDFLNLLFIIMFGSKNVDSMVVTKKLSCT